MQICRMFSLLNVFRRSIWAMNQLSLYDNTLVPLFLQLIGSYCSPVVLYIYFRSELRRKFKPTDSLKVVCVCVGVCERAMWTSRWMGMTELVCVCVPDDVYVSVLGSQVQRRRPVGVRGVSFFGLQQSSTHVTGQQQLDHLHTHTHTEHKQHIWSFLSIAFSCCVFFFF